MKYLAQQVHSFTSSNIAEEYPQWDPTTSYSLELDNNNLTSASMCIYGAFIYRSLTNSNLGNNPEETLNVYWVKWGVANRYAMLDLSANSKSYVDGGDLVVVFPQMAIDAVVLGNFEASKVKVELLLNDLTTVTWTYETEFFYNENVVDYWTYIYEDYDFNINRGFLVELPNYASYVRVTFTAGPSRSACGFLVAGYPVDMGATLADVNFSFNSFALKNTDEFGSLKITKRAVQDVVDFETKIDSGVVIPMKRKVKEIYNDIIVFILDPSDTSVHENMITLGTVESAGVIHTSGSKSIISWSIVEAI